jgi:putative nucleotidyltransferase with HDIG domain
MDLSPPVGTQAGGPTEDALEALERRRALVAILAITATASILLGAINLTLVWAPGPAVGLLLLAALCLPLVLLARSGRVEVAAYSLCAAILGLLTYALIEGDGLHDPGALAYPVVVIVGGLTLGRRPLWLLTAAAIASMSVVAARTSTGFERFPGDADDLLTGIALVLASAALTWLMMRRWRRHLELVRSSEAQVRHAWEQTLEGWVRALEFRDRETEGHSRRVTELSVGLARALGRPPGEVETIRRGALLHDIGKLAVPDRILLKPGPLDDAERAEVERHPEHARRMLSEIPYLSDVMHIPYSHHERWDGSGYPDRLRGEQIPFAARLFAVVDQWEALSSDRPYRAAWPRERVVSYLVENAGKIFDPEIVEVFLREVVGAAQSPSTS